MAILQRTVTNVSTNNPQPIVGSVLVQSQKKNDKFYSSKLLNYTESIEVDGFLKTVFFTEVNTNVNVGDRVFIVNGNFDSDSETIDNKYKKQSDGYRVLSVNGCRLVLDINYNGKKPYDELTTRNVIFIHHIETQEQFDYINSLKISISGQKTLKSIFYGDVLGNDLILGCQNIIYVSTQFTGSQNQNYLNSGVYTIGFHVRVDDGINNQWLNVTSFVTSNQIVQNEQFSDTGKLFILGNTFEYDNVVYKSGDVYKYEDFIWKLDITNYRPFISKLNFRGGKFRGTHNDGVFGSFDNKLYWEKSEWNSGVFLNSDWLGGFMNSKHTIEEQSFSGKIQDVGGVSTVIQIEDNTNNRGFGYNFIEKSTFFTYSIGNGNFYNCLFVTSSQYQSALDIYYGQGQQFTNVINGGKFEFCNIYDTRGNGGYFINSYIENSNLNISKVVSSETVNTSLNNSYWSTSGGIKLLGADIWSYDYAAGQLLDSPQSNMVGTLKLYISEEDYFKLSKGDTFYLEKINKEVLSELVTDDENILNKLETKFIIDNFEDWDLETNQNNSIQVSLSSSNENKWKYFVGASNQFVATYGYKILESDTDYWYTIPVSKLRGAFSSDYDTNVGYEFNDIVFDDISFYQYVPYDRSVLPNIRRASNMTEFESFSSGHLGEGLAGVGGVSDWLFLGTFSGKWSIDGIYQGYYAPEVPQPYFSPIVASGSIVSDGIDIASSNNFWIFVGQNEISLSYSGSSGLGIGLGNLGEFIEEDIPGQKTNAYNYDIVSKIYTSENFATSSNISLPSINISSKLFSWYIDEFGQYRDSIVNKISPISPQNVNQLFLNTVIGNGDFKSGVMENSTWISGDNINYSNNIIETLQGGYLNIIIDVYLGKKILKIKLKNRRLSTYFKNGYDYSIGDYIWLKSIKYDLNSQITSLDGRYKVVRFISGQSELLIESAETVDIIQNLSSGGQFYLTSARTNNYHSIHKFNLTKSKILSGKFKRTGIDNSIFENELFKKYIYPLADIKNTELIRLVNIMLQDTKNEVRSGIAYKCHFVNDIFNGGTFYNSFFLGGTFSDGLFKSSVWTGGNFNGGRFVDSRESTIFSFDFDTTNNIKLWQGGNFNGGEFFNSLWVRGNFNGGRFFFSDWTGGTWNNGVLGSKDLRTQDTTVAYYGPTTSFGATHTVWYNGLVENALIGGGGSIDWYGGKMIGGEFTSFGRVGKTYSIWHDGDFYGSSFTRQAWWKNGNFYSGKFLSEIGWDKANFLTHSNDIFDYGWVDGYFSGGEFGNANTSTNSVWYDGVMEGGVFQGRFWRNGLITNGKFFGSYVTQSQVSDSLKTYTQSFYGLWNDGFVDEIIYNVKRDRIVSTEDTQVSSKRRKDRPKIADLKGVVWKNGTFSHELSTFEDSVWLNGEFQSGNFNSSYFNPFVDATLKGLKLSDYEKSRYLNQINDEISLILQSVDLTSTPLPFYLSDIQDVVSRYNSDPQLNLDFRIQYFYYNGFYVPNPPDFSTLGYQHQDFTQFDSLIPDITVFIRISDEKILNLIPTDYIGISFYVAGSSNQSNISTSIYPNQPTWDVIPHSFNLSETCRWTGGNFNGGEFNYSVWNGGNFNDGVMNGAIWKDGVFNYGFMNNCYWENGVWRNGNWNGSPYDHTHISKLGNYWEITNKLVDQLLQNVASYSQNNKIHLSNVLVSNLNLSVEHTFDANGFNKWKFDEQNNS
jgi:hypothetical protein